MYGKILRIDLTENRVSQEPIPREWVSKYLGGEGINDILLWEHFLKVDPRTDPLSPENVLICGVGPLGATGALGAGTKVKWTFKSPTYNIFGDSVGGGFFGCHLRWAGYDYIVITGKAEKPVYLWINNDKVEIRDAENIWGKDVHQADTLIKEELGSSEIQTAITGQAGENLVRFACIVMSRNRCAGRVGGGCVMGSKNLKAIAVHGTKGIRISDPKRFLRVTEEAYNRMDDYPVWEMFAREGTMWIPNHYNLVGGNPWRNHQYNIVPQEILKNIDGSFFINNFKTRDYACSAGCATACSHWWRIRGHESPASARYAGEKGEKPEYTVMSGCMSWGMEDLAAGCHFQTMVDKYAVDGIEMGVCIGFLMELFQRGIITEKDIKEWSGEPINLSWGNYIAAEKIIESLVFKKNQLYELLHKGVYEAGKKIEELKGIPVMKYCQYGGKHSTFSEDIRSRRSWTLMMAVATRGADHLKALSVYEQMQQFDLSEMFFGTPYAADPEVPYTKGMSVAWDENRTAAVNCTGICIFNAAPFTYTGPGLEMIDEAYKAVTGIEAEDLLVIGERVHNIEKAFNSRLGLTRKDDTLCERWMKEPIPPGFPGEGKKGEDYFDLMLDEYYEYRGFDKESGLQTRVKLEELGLKEVADILERENALSNTQPRPREEVAREIIRRAENFKEK